MSATRKRFKYSKASASSRSGRSWTRLRSDRGFGNNDGYEAYTVCAISENLARETCVTSLDSRTPHYLQAMKQGNGQSYMQTLTYLEDLEPDEVLFNEGRSQSQLVRKIIELFGDCDEDAEPSDGRRKTFVKPLSRTCFDQTKGSEALARIARDDSYDGSVVSEYIVLSSVHAVLHYTEQSLGTTFLKNSVRLFVNSGGTNKMAIDRCTLVQLELLANAKSGKTKNSIIAAIDYTKTSVGERLLRTNIMAPPTNPDSIGMRQDLVDAFLSDKRFFYAVMERLKLLPCLDKMITNVAMVPNRNKVDIVNVAGKKESGKRLSALVNTARKGISALINIKTTLVAIPSFAQVLEERLNQISSVDDEATQDDGETSASLHLQLKTGLGEGPSFLKSSAYHDHHLLRTILVAMKQPALKIISHTVSNAFTNSTKTAERGSNLEARRRHEECYALKADSTSLMSVLRKKYIENVDEIHRLADTYAEKHGLFCSVRFSASRGYYLAISDVSSLPPGFINATRSGCDITCTTPEVVGLNIRAQDNVQDLLLMTDSRIQELLDQVRADYDALAALSDAVALLDLCHSFADCVVQKGTRPWCRPILTTGSNGIVIRKGRYLGEIPTFRNITDGAMEFVENDTYTTDKTNFTIITGINGSGKSTYLKQVAILVILAHCGGYVPAQEASIPIRDWLCTRIGNTDDQERNISTFMLEMKEIAFICREATARSIVLIDELGRATSNEDGMALAWAVSESLLCRGALTFFVTHYSHVTSLGTTYAPRIQNQHMAATVAHSEGGRISYTHKVAPGPCAVSSEYGVDLASACGWPEAIVDEARHIESALVEKSVGGMQQLAPSTSKSWVSLASSLVDHIIASTSSSTEALDPKAVKKKLAESGTYDDHFRGYFLSRAMQGVDSPPKTPFMPDTSNAFANPHCHDREISQSDQAQAESKPRRVPEAGRVDSEHSHEKMQQQYGACRVDGMFRRSLSGDPRVADSDISLHRGSGTVVVDRHGKARPHYSSDEDSSSDDSDDSSCSSSSSGSTCSSDSSSCPSEQKNVKSSH